MTNVVTAHGSKVFIGTLPVEKKTNSTAADFADTEWIQIKGLFELGELGADQTINEFVLLDEDWAQKSKGTRNGGTMVNIFVPIADDPGQIAFLAAIEDKCMAYQFKVERAGDCGTDVAGKTKLFQGLAFDGAESGGGEGDAWTKKFNIAVNGPILTV